MVSEKLIAEAVALLEEAAAQGYRDGYDKAKSEEGASAPAVTEPSTGGFSTEAARSNLTALRGGGDHVVAIMDTDGLVYAYADAWRISGKEALGIAYQDADCTLLMHPKRIEASAFGGDGISFGDKVSTLTAQWRTQSKVSAFDDLTGVSNTEGIVEKCPDSLAARCAAVEFANGQKGYMPASGEMRLMCKYLTSVDTLLEAIGGDKLKTQNGAQLLYTSTCRNASTVWCVRYSKDGDAQPSYRDKSVKCPTRVFLKL